MRHNKQITKDSSETANNIFEELSARHVATLGTIEHDGTPHLSVVYYDVSNQFEITFATKKKTLKHKNIQKNNNIKLLVFDEHTQLTVQVSGKTEVIKNDKQKLSVLDKMFELSSSDDFQEPPISKLYAGDYIAYRVTPKRITMALFMRPQTGSYDMFEVLEF